MKYFDRIFTFLQRVGQSLMIPVSVLPAAGLLVALGRVLQDQFATGYGHAVGEVCYSGGLAIFEQLSVVFAIGVAIGFTQGAGVAALAAAVGIYTLTNVLKVISGLHPEALAINTGVFGGILVGAMSAYLYNRFQKTQLPAVLGFFSGRRLVPILVAGSSILLGLALGVIWPPIQNAIHEFGQSVLSSPLGPALYAAGKRLLIPMGLHHVYYPPFLYEFGEYVNSAGKVLRGDSTRYFGGDPTAGVFMASEYPIMLFGLPAACIAMFLRARPERRRAVGGMMLSAALTSIITGITEPIEFTFIFVAPVLFVLHVALAFVSGLLTHYFDLHLGYTFSASLIDYGLGFFNQKNSWAFWTIIGPVIALAYFTGFYTLIPMLHLKTPGRETENQDAATDEGAGASSTPRAQQVLAALGGKENIDQLDACITRLRVTVKDPARVQIPNFKALGAAGSMVSGKNMQIIFGVESDLLKEQIRTLMQGGSVGAAAGSSVTKTPIAKTSTAPVTAKSFIEISPPMAGRVLELSQVPDATFAEKVLGDGFAVDPTEGIVRAPADGQILHLFPTGHAIVLKTDNNLEILIHIGIDTVKMKGEGFTALVKADQMVKKGQELIRFDLKLVQEKAKSAISPVIITNMDLVAGMKTNPSGLHIDMR